jgi:hypothetical protein
MGSDVDAVIAALKVALEEAQHSNAANWKVKAANRWIAQLPGAWRGRWRNLRLQQDGWGLVPREEFIAHVRATIAYLEASRTAGTSRTFAWSRRRGSQSEPHEQPFESSRKATNRGSRLLN